MKKVFSIIGTVVGVIVLAVLVFCIYFVVSVKDKTNNTPEDIITNNYTASEVFSREMTKALSYDEDVKLEIDTHDLNEILYGALTNVKISGIELEGAYVDYENGQYYVEIPAKAMGVSTCIKCKMTIALSQENGIQIQIKDFKMGKFDTDSFVVRKFVLNKSTRNSIVNGLAKKGISISIGKNLDISMNKEQLISTLSAVAPDSDLFVLIARIAMEADFVDFKTPDGTIGFNLYTENLLYDKTRDGDIDTFVNFTKAKNETEARLAETCTYKEVAAVFSYYVSGYDALNDKKKEIIDGLGYSTYEKGVKNTGSTMLKLILSHSPSLAETIKNGGFTIALSDSEINSVFEALSFIGAGTCFTDGTSAAYIAVDSLTFTMKDQSLEIRFVLNMNGKQICISAFADAEDSDSLALTAKVNKLSIGSEEMDSKYIGYVMEYLDGILSNQNWISTDCRDSLVLDFEEVISESNILSILVNKNLKRSVHIREDSLQIIFTL